MENTTIQYILLPLPHKQAEERAELTAICIVGALVVLFISIILLMLLLLGPMQ